MTKIPDKKKHADFQSRYRRSFNFQSEAKGTKLVLDENGQLVLRSEKKSK
ncbi:MAG: hypothetical protein AAF489_02185 [Bacteroidota bacterium]